MKRFWIMSVVVILLVVSGAGLYAWKTRVQQSESAPVSSVSPTPIPEEMEQWTDQAGFSFTYPKNLKVNNHPEDNENYAHIEFTHPDYPGSIIVWAKDTTAHSPAVWVSGEKTLKDGVIFETTLAGQPGKKVLVSSPKKRIVTATIDDAIVFFVEGEFDNSDYWSRVYDTVVSTFAFTSIGDQTAQSSAPGEGEDMAVDEEEVLE